MAAADVFAEHGYARATTNRIAERAGVHVPSVYQYFANKDALVAELWDRHVDELIDMLGTMLAANADAPIKSIARAYVVAVLALHAAKPALLAVLYDQGPALPGVRNLRDEAMALLVPFFERRRDELRPRNLHAAAFVLAAAVEGVARQAVIPPSPSASVLADEVTALVTTYLGAP